MLYRVSSIEADGMGRAAMAGIATLASWHFGIKQGPERQFQCPNHRQAMQSCGLQPFPGNRSANRVERGVVGLATDIEMRDFW